MKIIPLNQGFDAIVDDDDYEKVNTIKWFIDIKAYGGKYASRYDPKKGKRYMHRVIMGAMRGQYVDHLNGDTLDNRKSNLRICEHYQNLHNRPKQKNNTTGFKGVWLDKRRKTPCYYANIWVKGKKIHLGVFDTAEKAYIVYKKASNDLLGSFSYVNNGRI